MKTIGEIISLSSQFLDAKKQEKPRRVSEEIIASTLGLKRLDLYLQHDRPVLEEELVLIREKVKRASLGEPVQYITGLVSFLDVQIELNAHVLIPRPETEILADSISKRAKQGVLWDVCTGSGCIGIALKKRCPELEVTLSDISLDAAALAEKNAKNNEVELSIVCGDLFEPFSGKKADWIVCNPPYISAQEYEELDPSVKNFEPKLALVGGEDGLFFYRKFQSQVSKYLNPGGSVFFEIGCAQASALKKLFPQGEVHLDWAGLPRFFFLLNDDLLKSHA